MEGVYLAQVRIKLLIVAGAGNDDLPGCVLLLLLDFFLGQRPDSVLPHERTLAAVRLDSVAKEVAIGGCYD